MHKPAHPIPFNHPIIQFIFPKPLIQHQQSISAIPPTRKLPYPSPEPPQPR
ncbi:hypothetical protein BJY04DRAFT_149051 [Aspergillus karnatakaensis]|uniref:uncharacterized protein n=1 Tax=Aspergillus karnatakaensis TaxID=1810916 RepID=UPI003CCE157B